MNIKVEKLPKSAIKLNITVEKEKVKEAYEKAVDAAVEKTEIEGFRKGNAPRDMVVDKVGISTIHGDAVNELLQTTYPQALKEKMVAPVSNPRVEVKEFNIDKDFEYTAIIATRPPVKMKDYKKALKKRVQEKAAKNASTGSASEEEKEGVTPLGSNDVIEVLLKEADVEVADILVEEESDRMLQRLLNQLGPLNMTLEQYLKAQSKDAEELRKDYQKTAENNLKAEFIMGHLIKEEKIEVTDKEIDDMFDALGDEKLKERAKDPYERLYVKSILQKNKLISKLIENAEQKNSK